MFGHRWRSFRRDVDRHIERLLGCPATESPVRRLLDGFEEREDVLRAEFAHGCTSVQSAVSVCAMMFAAAIEQSPELWPEAVLVEHRLVDRDGPSGCTLETLMRRFLENAEKLLDKGLIDDRLFTFASSEILGTLEGLDADERSTHRVVGLFAQQRAEGGAGASA